MVSNTTVQTVYLIDDSEVDLFIQKRFIELSSFAENVVTFTSPVKALEAFNGGNAALDPNESGVIFLDLNMPILNGFEFLQRFNELSHSVYKQLKIVILTSSNSEADKKRAMDFPNVISFFSKPLNMHELERLSMKLRQ